MPDNRPFDANYIPEQSALNASVAVPGRGKIGFPYSKEHLDAPYGMYYLQTRYHWRTGKSLVGVAAAAGPSRVVQLHCPMMEVTYTWSAMRRDAWPVVPMPEEPDDNHILNDVVFEAVPVQPDEHGRAVTAVEGVYSFWLKEPIWNLEKVAPPAEREKLVLKSPKLLFAGIMPWTAFPAELNVIPESSFQPGLFGVLVRRATTVPTNKVNASATNR